ncbi:hypothetical protein Pph01_65050 [Planotetraspora phitsanulokensis]|uniref:Uncharacterized protein n=1 Tax=Planotetraspora phitsanulokensis TaxID=575192 RepID=A0A8J3UD80_9ACTN|nr:hypothetical protein Pph01_65050 [Planotetraspora phitsanulokensis]
MLTSPTVSAIPADAQPRIGLHGPGADRVDPHAARTDLFDSASQMSSRPPSGSGRDEGGRAVRGCSGRGDRVEVAGLGEGGRLMRAPATTLTASSASARTIPQPAPVTRVVMPGR